MITKKVDQDYLTALWRATTFNILSQLYLLQIPNTFSVNRLPGAIYLSNNIHSFASCYLGWRQKLGYTKQIVLIVQNAEIHEFSVHNGK